MGENAVRRAWIRQKNSSNPGLDPILKWEWSSNCVWVMEPELPQCTHHGFEWCEALSSKISPWRTRRAVSPLPTQKSNFRFFGHLWRQKCHSGASLQKMSPLKILVHPENTFKKSKNRKIAWAVGVRNFVFGEKCFAHHELPLWRFLGFRIEFLKEIETRNGLILDDRLENRSKQWMTLLMTNFCLMESDNLVPRMKKNAQVWQFLSKSMCLTVGANEERRPRVCFVAKIRFVMNTLCAFWVECDFSEKLDSDGAQGWHYKSIEGLLLRSCSSEASRQHVPQISWFFLKIPLLLRNTKKSFEPLVFKIVFVGQNLMFVNCLFSDFRSLELNFEMSRPGMGLFCMTDSKSIEALGEKFFFCDDETCVLWSRTTHLKDDKNKWCCRFVSWPDNNIYWMPSFCLLCANKVFC